MPIHETTFDKLRSTSYRQLVMYISTLPPVWMGLYQVFFGLTYEVNLQLPRMPITISYYIQEFVKFQNI